MAAGLSEGHQLSGQAFLEAALLSLLISPQASAGRVAVPVPVSSDHNSNEKLDPISYELLTRVGRLPTQQLK